MNKRFVLLATLLATVGLITLGTLEYRGHQRSLHRLDGQLFDAVAYSPKDGRMAVSLSLHLERNTVTLYFFKHEPWSFLQRLDRKRSFWLEAGEPPLSCVLFLIACPLASSALSSH